MKTITLRLLCLLIPTLTFGQNAQKALECMDKANKETEKNNWTEAIKYYNQALTYNPDFSTAIAMKGLCYVQIGQTDSACSSFVDGIEMGSKNSKDYFPKYCNKYKPKLETDNFKSGKFIYVLNATEKYFSKNADTTAYLTRDKDFQIEYFQNSKYHCKFEIKWKSDTEYELKFVETNDPNLSFLKKGDKLKVKILKVMGDKYLYYSDLNGVITYARQQKINN